MEFDFIYLPDSRIYQLKLPMEQHALQRFLLDEFERNALAYQPLLEQLQNIGPYTEYQFEGREYILKVERQEVLVYHHSVGQFDERDAELEAELTTDDASLTAECGLEDFIHLLGEWQKFLPKK
ncbi:YacL family protein [Rheinheimera sp.]|uniref:YacL family protein n=1 Tax=Rheinheimera sp. TaxID=1869214 RepID=UPI0027B996E8|nr:YacL family protein [Rheinheimera sp.]